MAFISRYSSITRGGLRLCGNTLGLSKLTNLNQAGVRGSIGAFSAQSGTVATFPAGTTLNYTVNSSAALLNLPAGSSVLYAELIWGGNCRSRASNITSLINDPVTFTTPNATLSVTPAAATAQYFEYVTGGITLAYYVRTANVTAAVAAAGSGTYRVGRVPALVVPIDADTSDTNHAGWTLAVVYENPAETLNYLALWTGGALVNPDTTGTDITVTGFLTPPSGAFSARAFVSAGEGDAVISGDRCLFGKDLLSLQTLSGTRNPAGNFFASQICNETGALDTSGTFGTRNADPATGTNTSACRQGWDITSVDASAAMQNGQSSAVFRFTTTGDLYIPNTLALRIESRGAFLAVGKSAPQSFAVTGQTVTYTVTVSNTGELTASGVTLSDIMSSGPSLVPGSIKINGVAQAGGFPVALPDIASGQSVIVTYDYVTDSLPSVNPAVNRAEVGYTFFPFPDTPVTRTVSSPPVSVLVLEENLKTVKSADRDFAVKGDIITYTSVVTNDSNLTLQNALFADPVPSGTAFVAGSVTVDGVSRPSANPEAGFTLGDLAPAQVVTVVFQVIVL